MSKAASPVRLQKELLEAATISGQIHHRSAVGQIEHWATIGRMLDDLLDPETLLAVSAGFKRLSVEVAEVQAIDPDQLFNQLEEQRSGGRVVHASGEGEVAYQSSADHPGLIEQIQHNGERTVGRFEEGVFTPLKTAS
ncbi:MAG: hypothetical protein VW985_14105 [Gammaproteobacteria bacterium]